MSSSTSDIILTFPRSVAGDVATLSDDLRDRMHELLERNTDGTLSTLERSELEKLVQLAQFSQIVAMALASAKQMP